MQPWNLIRQLDAMREAANHVCQSEGAPVSRGLLPTAPPPVAACGEVRMTREERMRALGCMGRAMMMHDLARGVGLGMPCELFDAVAHKAMAAMMKRHAAARAPPFHPCHPLPFSTDPSHSAPDVILSPDGLTVTRSTNLGFAWARCARGVDEGCGVVRWAVQLSKESGYGVFCVGVASDAFDDYTGSAGWPKHSWYFCDSCAFADGQPHRRLFQPPPYAAGDVVTVELQRTPGVDGVLRVWVAGKTPRELRGLPKDGMMYPIVCLSNNEQSISMVALP